jgi:hypothetical protein
MLRPGRALSPRALPQVAASNDQALPRRGAVNE